MSLHDLSPPRKRRRLGLYLPFVLLLAAVAGWTAYWLYARSETRVRMDAAVASLKAAGYEVSWGERGIGGYPFRMNVTLTDARVREPSGWALTAPKLEAQAYMHAVGQWMLAAPDGATFVRPIGGPVAVKGELIRASLGGFDRHPPRFSFEGVKLTFQPAAGAQPFALSAADRVEFHLRPGPDDEGGLFVKVDNGAARLSGLFGRIAGDRPISIVWESTLSKISAFKGRDWPDAVRNWTDAGGLMNVRRGGVTAGEAVVGANSGALSVGSDGRLTGVLDVTLRQAPRVLGAMGETGVIAPETAAAAVVVTEARQGANEAARATINFQAGQTTLGPVAIGPAPKVYQR
ncbi:DUF2125 domain-containing protein [Phenylobacterium sp.]|uniref:DUF2125 domain-containing protein n=1 Tax=Phenylobacterium sp. TaxID=1871053 RepID=UPI00398337F7